LNSLLRYLCYLVVIAAGFGIGLLAFAPRSDHLPAVAQLPGSALVTCAAAADCGSPSALPGRDIDVIPVPARPIAARQAVPDRTPAESRPAALAERSPTVAAEPPAKPATVAVLPTATAATSPPAVEIAPTRPHAPRRAATAEIKSRAAAKKPSRRELAARRPAAEAREVVRRFGDDLRDLPVSSYAGDGTRRNIVIRPTNIQDVYYYSRPH
jgi:hypothetical protein